MYHHPECVKGPTDFHYYKIPNACCHLRPRCVCREGYRLHRDYRSLPARAGGYQITLATLDGYTLKITAIFFGYGFTGPFITNTKLF